MGNQKGGSAAPKTGDEIFGEAGRPQFSEESCSQAQLMSEGYRWKNIFLVLCGLVDQDVEELSDSVFLIDPRMCLAQSHFFKEESLDLAQTPRTSFVLKRLGQIRAEVRLRRRRLFFAALFTGHWTRTSPTLSPPSLPTSPLTRPTSFITCPTSPLTRPTRVGFCLEQASPRRHLDWHLTRPRGGRAGRLWIFAGQEVGAPGLLWRQLRGVFPAIVQFKPQNQQNAPTPRRGFGVLQFWVLWVNGTHNQPIQTRVWVNMSHQDVDSRRFLGSICRTDNPFWGYPIFDNHSQIRDP